MKIALLLAALALGACALKPQPQPGDISLYDSQCWGHEVANCNLGHGMSDDVWEIRRPSDFDLRKQ